jgi:pyrroline-5-carboxylate reductase
MNNKTFGFIGGGRITRIFLEGWEKTNFKCNKIVVSDSNVEVLNNLKKIFPAIEITNNNQLPAGQEMVFLALHPPAIGEFLNQIKTSFKKDPILISLAPKFTIQKISEALGGFNRIIRMNPNAPSIINEGFNPVTFSYSFTKSEKEELLEFFSLLGSSPEVDENKIEAFAVITAMGPTYFWFQLYELKKLAESFGLNEKEINNGITKMIIGAVDTLFKSELTTEEVMDLVPVKPIGEAEESIKEIYNSKITAIFNKIKP